MTKKQKIWLGIFGAMFLIPEILWISGIRGNIEIPWFPINDFKEFKNILIAYFTTLIPFIGLVGIFKIISKLKINKKMKTFIFITLIPLLCWTAFLTFILFWVMIYYIDRAPQIG